METKFIYRGLIAALALLVQLACSSPRADFAEGFLKEGATPEPVAEPTPTQEPAPVPTATPAPENPFHVSAGPSSALRALAVVEATANEFAPLMEPTGTLEEKIANTETMLLRTIWHLQLAGFQSGRQRNPSGAISKDKLTVMLEDGTWHTYDIYTDWDVPEARTRVVFVDVGAPNPVAESGIAD